MKEGDLLEVGKVREDVLDNLVDLVDLNWEDAEANLAIQLKLMAMN